YTFRSQTPVNWVNICKYWRGSLIDNWGNTCDPCTFWNDDLVPLPYSQSGKQEMNRCRTIRGHQCIFATMPSSEFFFEFLDIGIGVFTVPAIAKHIGDNGDIFLGYPWPGH